MMRYILFALLAWFIYNLVFRFIIPVYKTTRQMKQKFRDMQQQMQDQMKKQQAYTEPSSTQKETPQKPGGDYIDFEEIK